MAVDAVIHSSQRIISPFLETTEPVAGLSLRAEARCLKESR
jgi:hypothetical protein